MRIQLEHRSLTKIHVSVPAQFTVPNVQVVRNLYETLISNLAHLRVSSTIEIKEEELWTSLLLSRPTMLLELCHLATL